MKRLSKMLLIHWHNYAKEVIEFDTINFLTGKTAAGKSTVIDALQLVLLGDASGSYFNKAANEKSTRTLKSYLYGEKGDDGDTGYLYLRNGRFTSYIVLEFIDTEKNQPFLVGFVCDCQKDQSFTYRFFVVRKRGLPDYCFIDEKTNTPYDIAGLRAFLSRYCKDKRDFDMPETNKRYQDIANGLFGQIKQKYRVLLKKAVPFSTISNIEQFITESIGDVKNRINIENMQTDIRQYKRLEQEVKILSEKVEKLKIIEDLSNQYEHKVELLRQQEYVVARADKELARRKEKGLYDLLEQMDRENNDFEERIHRLEKEEQAAYAEREKLSQEYHGSDIKKKGEQLDGQIKAAKETIAAINQAIGQAIKRLRDFGKSWSGLEWELLEGDDQSEVPLYLEAVAADLEFLTTVTEETGEKMNLSQVAERLDKLRSTVQQQAAKLDIKRGKLNKKLEELDGKIADLEQGIKPYPKEVQRLQRILTDRLIGEAGETVPVDILADCLEVKDEKWRNAIEAYLDQQKFYLIVPPKYFVQALRIYDQVKAKERLSDIGLVDIGKLWEKVNIKVLSGSLAEEIDSENKAALSYANYLLGRVMKCEQADKLRSYPTSITPECMLYKGFVARHLPPYRYQNPYIGRASLTVLLENLRNSRQQIEDEYQVISSRERKLKQYADKQVLSSYEAEEQMTAFARRQERREKQELVRQLQQEYEALDFTWLDKLKNQIDGLENKVEELRKETDQYKKKRTQNETQIDNIKKKDLISVLEELNGVTAMIAAKFSEQWISEVGEAKFLEILRSERTLEKIRANYYSSQEQARNAMKRLLDERTTKRSDYNKDYKMSFDVTAVSNERFTKELAELSEIRLPEYVNKIVDAKEKAYDQFRDDFIAKLKSNIETISMQMDELNTALKKSVFGTDTYRFVKHPRVEYKEYYDMIMDPLLMDTGGYNIASESFNQKYQQQIADLFQKLIYNEAEVTAERRAEYEKAIRKFTDYRTYLTFDLIVKNDKGEEQRLSKTFTKKSGGETQIPFYISMLASFSQVCRISMKKNNTIRVIILDEAFSKMDGERIKECIRLLRRFELQAIFSAPSEKIAEIAPMVDRNIVVFKDTDHSFVKYYDPKQLEDEADSFAE